MGLFSKIFGGSKSKSSSTPVATIAQQPQYIQDAFKRFLEQGEDLSQDISLFRPEELTSDALRAFDVVRTTPTLFDTTAFNRLLSDFTNPFQEQVIDSVTRDLAEQRDLAQAGIRAGINEAGAFGSSGQALLEAENQQSFLETLGDVTGRLRAGEFGQARDLASRQANIDQQATLSRASDLLAIDELRRGIASGTRQAPLSALQFFGSTLQGLPVGTAQSSFGKEQDFGKGILGKVGGGLQGISKFFGG